MAFLFVIILSAVPSARILFLLLAIGMFAIANAYLLLFPNTGDAFFRFLWLRYTFFSVVVHFCIVAVLWGHKTRYTRNAYILLNLNGKEMLPPA